MKKSKIKNIESIKPHTNDYGTTHYHNLELENGEKINIGKKKELQVGWEVIYEIVDQDGKSEYVKAKSVSLQDYNNANPEEAIKKVSIPGTSTQFKADPLKQASIEQQVALKEANLYHATHGFNNEGVNALQQIVDTATFFYNEFLK